MFLYILTNLLAVDLQHADTLSLSPSLPLSPTPRVGNADNLKK